MRTNSHTAFLLVFTLLCYPTSEARSQNSNGELLLAEECLAGFYGQPSYQGNCLLRPQGSICLEYEDHYRWLIFESVVDWRQEICDSKAITVAIGTKSEYH